MIGTTVIIAESGGINSTTSIEVTRGYPFEIKSMFNQTNVSIDDIISLNATLVDRAGNPGPGDLTYRSQNEQTQAVAEEITPAPETTEKKESGEDLRARLSAEAKKTGVMQAAPGTEQGKTGWYVDSTGELTSWLVSETGEWTRVS